MPFEFHSPLRTRRANLKTVNQQDLSNYSGDDLYGETFACG
jgi:hypothetical protein